MEHARPSCRTTLLERSIGGPLCPRRNVVSVVNARFLKAKAKTAARSAAESAIRRHPVFFLVLNWDLPVHAEPASSSQYLPAALERSSSSASLFRLRGGSGLQDGGFPPSPFSFPCKPGQAPERGVKALELRASGLRQARGASIRRGRQILLWCHRRSIE